MKMILAHRGIIKNNYKENSIESLCEIFKYSSNKFKLGVELDINMSKDNKIFIFHDSEINTIKLHTLTFQEIHNLDKNIFLLTDLLNQFDNKNYVLDIEIKKYPENKKKYCNTIVNIIKKYNNLQYFFSSFSSEICDIINKINTKKCYKLSHNKNEPGEIVHYLNIDKTTKGVYTLFDKNFTNEYLKKIENIDILITDDMEKLIKYMRDNLL